MQVNSETDLDLGDDLEAGRSSGSGRCTCCSFACAVCRILCYTICRRICSCCVSPPPTPKQEFAVLCLGLEGVGKSTLLSALAGEPVENMPPTMGFAIKAMVTQKAILNVKELGGSDGIRSYWDRYFSGHVGIIFVIDSTASQEQLLESKQCLSRCLDNSALHGLPVLVVCSKMDSPNARRVEEVEEAIKDELEERKWTIVGSSPESVEETKKELEVFVDMLLEDSA